MLLEIHVSKSFEEAITHIIHAFVSHFEEPVIDDVCNNGRVLRFSRLLPPLLKPNSGIPVITTNYDRLIEVAVESSGLTVDNTFTRKYLSSFNPRESMFGLCRALVQRSKRAMLDYSRHVSVYKPHGSLDWFLVNSEPVCSSLFESKDKLMITPGASKLKMDTRDHSIHIGNWLTKLSIVVLGI